jgi:hypothetical protein
MKKLVAVGALAVLVVVLIAWLTLRRPSAEAALPATVESGVAAPAPQGAPLELRLTRAPKGG